MKQTTKTTNMKDNITVVKEFLDKILPILEEIEHLVRIKIYPTCSSVPYPEITITSPIPEEFFPPCIQNILVSRDNREKLAVFMLINFLENVGWWNKEEISGFLKEWNKKNIEPLSEVYINERLFNFKAGEKCLTNCNSEGYALGIGVCKPDDLCKQIKLLA